MKEEKINIKSDVPAKKAFVELLIQKGYSDVKIVSSPADVIAVKEGIKYYFEIKSTNKEDTYFGAATLTEWIPAINNPSSFTFVIAKKRGDSWEFIEFTPQEFMRFNTVPPFKTYFNIPLKKRDFKSQKKLKKSIILTEERLKRMENFWNSLKN